MTTGDNRRGSDALAAYCAAHRERFYNDITELVRIPSVSALPAHRDDLERAAAWVADRLRAAGVPEVAVLPTGGHPVVWGAWPAPRDPATGVTAPTLLIYGHYDTQPADPFDEWQTPPFEPVVRDGCLYGRGATDDKGNLLIPIAVVEAFAQTEGRPPLGLVFLIEGEEEIGSPHLRSWLQAERDRLRATVAVSADGAMWGENDPSLVLSAKGLVGLQVDLCGASSDLHSGLYGGIAPNALNALVMLLATIWDAEGRIVIDGFHDGVRPLTGQERDEIAAVPFDAAEYQRALGSTALVGDPDFTPLERNWLRPTLDLNGLWGGFQGAGSKTVIPAEAHAKITCRLVPGQEPAAIITALQRHLTEHCPPGVVVTVTPIAGSSRAYEIPGDHPALLAAREALGDEYDRDPLLTRLGGTLPVAEYFKTDLGLDTVFLAWEMPDERMHGPNEFFRLANFDRGLRVYADLFSRLASGGSDE